MRPELRIFVIIGILFISEFSSFADTASISSSDKKSPESSAESDESSKEKRSSENIMFGNQQNRPSTIADVIMNTNKDVAEDKPENKTSGTKLENEDDKKLKDFLEDDNVNDDDKRNLPLKPSVQDPAVDSSSNDADWYSNIPSVSQDTLQYLLNTSPLQPIRDVNSLYDQDELYRRKRQLQSMVALRKRRSLRSPLGQMIQARGRRLPRRSMRFKRQVVDMQDLIALLNKASTDNGQKYFSQKVPVNNYRSSESSFRHSHDAIPQDKQLDTTDIPNFLGGIADNGDEDEEEYLRHSEPLLPFGSKYFELEDFQPNEIKSSSDEEDQNGRNWMEPDLMMPSTRRPSSVFSVARRSANLFYPIDYRFIPGPGFKKRSSFSGQRGNDEQETEFGKWGKVVNVPDAFSSAEDVARLYDLANLLAESENPEIRNRRAT